MSARSGANQSKANQPQAILHILNVLIKFLTISPDLGLYSAKLLVFRKSLRCLTVSHEAVH